MGATELLWTQEVRHHALSISPEMHDYYAFLRKTGWFDEIVDAALEKLMDFLDDGSFPEHASLEGMKRELVQDNPRGVANAVFRFIIADTIEKLGSANAGPTHWVTAAYFWFKWKDAYRTRMMEARDRLPEYIHV